MLNFTPISSTFLPHPQVAWAGLGIGFSQYNSSLQLLPPCTFPLLHCWLHCSSSRNYPTGPMRLQGECLLQSGLFHNLLQCLECLLLSFSALVVCPAVSHSSTCPAFLLFLKYVFTEAPQTSLMCSSLACGGSVAELAVPSIGQSLTSPRRCLPCSPPQLPKPCHGNPVQRAIRSGTIRPDYFGSTSEMACIYWKKVRSFLKIIQPPSVAESFFSIELALCLNLLCAKKMLLLIYKIKLTLSSQVQEPLP